MASIFQNMDKDYLANVILPCFDGYESWSEVEPVLEGWSGEAKYHIITNSGEELLLRVGDAKRKHHNVFAFDALKDAALKSLKTPHPITCGETKDRSYSFLLLSWLPGYEIGDVLPTLSCSEQYELGRKAGLLLRSIHALRVDVRPKHHTEDWHEYCKHKLHRVTKLYKNQDIHFSLIETCIGFAYENLNLTKNREQTFQHGDFHIGNIILLHDKEVGAIDFSRCSLGDPWDDFHRSVWCAEVSPAFASGKVDSYFNDCIPKEFFPLVAFYTALNQIGFVTWAQQFGEEEVQSMLQQARNIDSWYDGFAKTTPSWYAPPDNDETTESSLFE